MRRKSKRLKKPQALISRFFVPRLATAILGMIFCGTVAFAQFRVPTLSGPVVDLAGMLDENTKAKLRNLLQQAYERGDVQLAVLTVPSLEGLSIEEASIKIVDSWKLGTKEKDNGILLIIAKKDRRMRIEVGQGLEGDLPDALAKRIIAETMEPAFRVGDFSDGILRGAYEILTYASPKVASENEILPPPRSRRSANKFVHALPFLIFFFIFIVSLNRDALGGRRRARRGRGNDYWGSGGGFGGGGFGGGGGGFGGGGGGFSGGGASGGW